MKRGLWAASPRLLSIVLLPWESLVLLRVWDPGENPKSHTAWTASRKPPKHTWKGGYLDFLVGEHWGWFLTALPSLRPHQTHLFHFCHFSIPTWWETPTRSYKFSRKANCVIRFHSFYLEVDLSCESEVSLRSVEWEHHGNIYIVNVLEEHILCFVLWKARAVFFSTVVHGALHMWHSVCSDKHTHMQKHTYTHKRTCTHTEAHTYRNTTCVSE